MGKATSWANWDEAGLWNDYLDEEVAKEMRGRVNWVRVDPPPPVAIVGNGITVYVVRIQVYRRYSVFSTYEKARAYLDTNEHKHPWDSITPYQIKGRIAPETNDVYLMMEDLPDNCPRMEAVLGVVACTESVKHQFCFRYIIDEKE